MNQFFIGLILILGTACYWLYSENRTLATNNMLLEGAVAEQEAAIESLQQDFAVQTEALQTQTLLSQQAQRELNRYGELEIDSRYFYQVSEIVIN